MIHTVDCLQTRAEYGMFRLVCRNATKLLKRKDSSGAILKDGQLKPADYSHSLSLQNVRFSQTACFKIQLSHIETLIDSIL